MAALMITVSAQAQPVITETDARAFVARQMRAWNDSDLNAYFADYAPDATFTDQAYVGDKPPVPYGTSTLAQARALAGKAMARSKLRETVQFRRLTPGPRGSAIATSHVASTLDTSGKTRRLCAARRQILVHRQGRVLSSGKTDTYYPCPR